MKKIQEGKFYSLTESEAEFISEACCIPLRQLILLTTKKKCIKCEVEDYIEKTIYRLKFEDQDNSWLYREKYVKLFKEYKEFKQEELEV